MKILEAHNGLSAKLIENSDYDGIWVSSLTHSASKGLPDNELIPLSDRVDLVREVRRVSTKPIIVDIDTGGNLEHISTVAKWFEDAGAYAVIMEDKRGTKQNSLLEDGKHELEDVDVFAEKIKKAKSATKTLKIYARLESLIAKRSKYEAVLRARAYMDAGADGIMIHSKTKVDATEVMEVAKELREIDPIITLIAVPTTYVLPENHPFDIVIEANHLMRASLFAMKNYIKDKGVGLSSVQDIFDLVGK
jgi:2-methylisocitrate lyase-like PEP mutase family enzyme